MEFSDVLLPIAPCTETPGTFVNAEGRVQSFHAVVKTAGDARPAWKVMRVIANLLGLPGFGFESAQEVLMAARGAQDAQASVVQGGKLSNATSAAIDASTAAGQPVTAAIYQLDSIVRRAPSLQLTADGRLGPTFVRRCQHDRPDLRLRQRPDRSARGGPAWAGR